MDERSAGPPQASSPPRGAGAVHGDLGVALSRWAQLSSNELSVLEGLFWSHGRSRDVLASALNFSKTRANAVVAGLIERAGSTRSGRVHRQAARRQGQHRRDARDCDHATKAKDFYFPDSPF